ncbi:hypothetical protein GF373_14500 [bacterium]|nr:hypothetical protein [bacterium]
MLAGFFLLLFSALPFISQPSYAAIPPAGALIYSSSGPTLSFNQDENRYVFSYVNDATTYEYEIHPNNNLVKMGNLRARFLVNGENVAIPLAYTGLIVENATGETTSPDKNRRLSNMVNLKHWVEKDRLHIQHEENIEGSQLKKEYTLRMQGKTLIFHVSATSINSATARYIGFDFEKGRFGQQPAELRLPTLPIPLARIQPGFYCSMYVDPTVSSAGRYENTESYISTNSFDINNSPVYLLENDRGEVPHLELTAYITISKRFRDVLPVIPPNPRSKSEAIRYSPVLNFHQNLFAHHEYRSQRIIRRWDAPESGNVNLNGHVSLHDGSEQAMFEVHYVQPAEEKSHILFSQILNNTSKPRTGIAGEFPMNKGEKLLFVTYGPAVMTGGKLDLDVTIEQNYESYNSQQDFASTQGEQGWYYEYEDGYGPTFMLWNSENKRWEHPQTRAYQTAGTLVNRSGVKGDAFSHAKDFLETLGEMGIKNSSFILTDWAAHAVQDTTRELDGIGNRWGTADSLRELVQFLRKTSGRVIQPIALEPSAEDDFSAYAQSILRKIRKAKETHSFDALLLENAKNISPQNPLLLEKAAEPSSRRVWKDVGEIVERVNASFPVPLLAWGETDADRFDPYLATLLDGVVSPIGELSNARNLVDEELSIGRSNGCRIGLGSYSEYQDVDTRWTDPRIFPLDQYWSTMVAYGRVPYFSDRFWYPGLSNRDLRMMIMEFDALLAPVAREYMNPQNQLDSIFYALEDGTELTTEQAIDQNKQDNATRVTSRYKNGLVVKANRSGDAWIYNEMSRFKIARDGFLATNPSTGLFSLIGSEFGQRFSACFTADYAFVHSREGTMATIRDLSTDGMIKRYAADIKSTDSRHNYVCLGVRELRQSDLTPILLSNARLDVLCRWVDAKTLSLRIVKAPEMESLLDYYDLPQKWFREGKQSISVEVTREGEPAAQPVFWLETVNQNRRGIRIPSIHTGDTFMIRYQP